MIVTFEDYTPVPRYDGTPWTTVLIAESATANGPWTTIDTQAILPVDSDPEHPDTRNFTTTLAAIANGWYRLTFQDGAALSSQPTPPVHQSKSSNYAPSPAQVARKNMSRTRGKFGDLVGTYNENTIPTDTQVLAITADVLTEVADMVGDDIPPELYDDARNVAAIRVAMQIELDFFSDQVNTGRSIYPQLEKEYEREIANLGRAVQLIHETGADGVPTSQTPSRRAQGSFPDPSAYPPHGLSTRW